MKGFVLVYDELILYYCYWFVCENYSVGDLNGLRAESVVIGEVPLWIIFRFELMVMLLLLGSVISVVSTMLAFKA